MGGCRGGSRGQLKVIAPLLKPTKDTLFAMILYNSENSIRDVRTFCCPLFRHSSVVKYTLSLLQQQSCYETRLANITEIDFFGANTDTSAIHGLIVTTNISKFSKSCFLLHYQKYN